MQEVGHGSAHDQRDGGHQDRERTALSRRRRSGKLESTVPLGRQQPRRPVEVDARAVSRRMQGRVRRPVMRQAEQRAADGNELAGLPLRGGGERLAVQGGLHPLIGGDLAAAPAVDEHPQGARGNGPVPDAHVHRAAADVGVAGGQPVKRAGAGAAYHPDLRQPAWLRRHAALGTAQAEYRPVRDRGLKQAQLGRDQPAADVQRQRARLAGFRGSHGKRPLRARTGEPEYPRTGLAAGTDRRRTLPSPVAVLEAPKLGGDLGHRCRRVGLEHNIGGPSCTRRHDRQRQPHDRPFTAVPGHDPSGAAVSAVAGQRRPREAGVT